MRPVTVSATIDAPREEVFEYLSDLANHVEFSDHYLKEFRLERLESRGLGASVSFRLGRRAQWGEVVVTGLEPPYRIELAGHAGRLGRVAIDASYTLTPSGHRMTTVEYTVSTTPATRVDALRESLGKRIWLKRQSRRSMRRLAALLEGGGATAHAARVAAG
jgi:uncharacterized protein YndB with AHSA1/START domain